MKKYKLNIVYRTEKETIKFNKEINISNMVNQEILSIFYPVDDIHNKYYTKNDLINAGKKFMKKIFTILKYENDLELSSIREQMKKEKFSGFYDIVFSSNDEIGEKTVITLEYFFNNVSVFIQRIK